jgi:hypothetical protein
MANLDDLLSSLPQETQDLFKVARIEGEEAARKSAQVARDNGLPLSVKDGDDVFINVKALRAIIQTAGVKALLGEPSPEDFGRLIVSLGDTARAAEIYADEA